jgi:branched-chain amino acid transport system ATP-binding protein
MGLLPSAGDRLFDGAPLSAPEAAVGRGLTLVPEGRELLGSMTVEDHLRLGAYAVRRRARTAADLQRVDSLFPILAERRRQSAASLSGGQQQMLAIARALMSGPRLLVVDEPLLGLAPLVVEDILDAIVRLAADGVSVLLVEQNAATVLPILDRAYVLEQGRIVAERDPVELGHSLERGVARAAPIP